MKYRGFTLIELVVTIGIIAIIASALAIFIVDNFRYQRRALEEGQSQGEAQRIVRSMREELRGAIQGENGAYPIAGASGQELVFFSDYDLDGEVERIRYTLSDTILQKGIIEPIGEPASYLLANEDVSTLTTNAANSETPLFNYFDENYAGTGEPMNPILIPNIRLVEIDLLIDTWPASENEGLYEVRTQINLRNLKDNNG